MTAQEEKKDELTELVLEIQGGNRDLMSVLWDAVNKFIRLQAIRLQARRRFALVGEFDGCELEDLIQAGYIALSEAVELFDTSREAGFLTILTLCLKNAFAEAAGIRTKKRDAILYAESLNTPADPDDPDGETKLDLQADQVDPFEDAENAIYIEDLHRAIETALESLQPIKREIIRQRYFEGHTLAEVATATGKSSEAVRQQERDALRKLCREYKKNGLDQFVETKVDEETSFYRPSGVETFKRTGFSAVEQTYFQREQLRAEARRKYTVIPGG